MSFNKNLLPDARDYYEGQGLVLSKGKKWVTTSCCFHGGSDSLRVNLETGGFICMAECGARGGDVLAYHRALHQGDFVSACKDLGCWVEDGKDSLKSPRPSTFPPRDALKILEFETALVGVYASTIAKQDELTPRDIERLYQSINRIQKITGCY